MTQLRTSKSHPLRIDDIFLPEFGGSMGMTLCPGKCGQSMFGYTWKRDMNTDMQAILDWGADAIVTLMESDELVKYHAEHIEVFCENKNIDWFHLPVRDVDIPDQHFEHLWTYSGIKLRQSLKNGKKILIHCRGGLGRTGTIVARLLIELGWNPGKAIDTIRKQRPGSIETLAQEQYSESCQIVSISEDKLLSRVLGCLFGGAIGDGLGYLVEFDRIEEIRKNYGKHGISNPISNNLITVSDDTQMTLFTMEGLLRSQDESLENKVAEVRTAYLDWLCTQIGNVNKEIIKGQLAFSPILQKERAPGNTCLGALEIGGHGQPEEPINNSKGCGSVMRVAPVGLFSSDLKDSEIFELGMRTGALTHGHMTSSLSAGMMALMITKLMAGKNLKDAVRLSLEMLDNYPENMEVQKAVTKAIELSEQDVDDHPDTINKIWGDENLKDHTSRGWVAEEALAIGLYGALQGQSYSDTIQIAANHNGDSDSTASVAGQLYGTWEGVDIIPHKWITKVDVFDEILSLISKTIPLPR